MQGTPNHKRWPTRVRHPERLRHSSKSKANDEPKAPPPDHALHGSPKAYCEFTASRPNQTESPIGVGSPRIAWKSPAVSGVHREGTRRILQGVAIHKKVLLIKCQDFVPVGEVVNKSWSNGDCLVSNKSCDFPVAGIINNPSSNPLQQTHPTFYTPKESPCDCFSFSLLLQ